MTSTASSVGMKAEGRNEPKTLPAVAIDRLRDEIGTPFGCFAGEPDNTLALVHIDDAQALITAYESQAKRLREVEGALEPFADKAALIDDVYEDDYCPMWSPFIPVRAYRRAAALTQSPPAMEKTDGRA